MSRDVEGISDRRMRRREFAKEMGRFRVNDKYVFVRLLNVTSDMGYFNASGI